MTSKDPEISTAIANNADFCPVTVCFQDPAITLLFAELLSARGVQVCLAPDLKKVDKNTRIITEPYYFPIVPSEMRSGCLVVGDRESLQGVQALKLPRPLTEEGVESALNEFLKA